MVSLPTTGIIEMSNRAAELKDLTTRFVDAFNQQDLDSVVSFFAEDAVYEDSSGGSHSGPAAIRAAFAPLLAGDPGKIHFDGEDYFAEVENNKVMTSWTLAMKSKDKTMLMRGLDILEFRGDKLVRKLAYCKAATPHLTEAK